jgi:predicted nucleic acid-binding protein
VILLDTSVLSRVFRRRRMGPEEQHLQTVVEELMAGDVPLGLPGIVLQEVLSGVRSEKQFADLERRLLASFSIVNASTRNHVDAARLKNKCLTAGLAASGPDCLIAVLAIAGDHELFAMDADFAALAKHARLRLFRAKGIA